MKAFKTWSASQVGAFNLCNRKWYFNKIMGIEEPKSQALEDGIRYAGECEVYMKTGKTDGLSAVTRPITTLYDHGLFPRPAHSNTLVEYPVGVDFRAEKSEGVHEPLLFVDGLPGVGFIDVLNMKEDRPIVWDFKSTKDKKWIKTSDELRSDVQMAGVYAAATTILHQRKYGKLPQLVGVGHVALLKPPRTPEAVVVGPAWLTPDDIDAQWAQTEKSVRAMKEVALFATPDRVTASWSACSAFGGCPHKDRCQALRTLTPATSIPQSKVGTMSLLDNIKAQRASAPGTAPASTPAATGPAAMAARIQARLATPGQINPPDAASGGAAAPLQAAQVPVQRGAAGTAAPTAVVKPGLLRSPRNGDARLAALGWSPEDIADMNIERKHAVLDGKVQAPSKEEEPAKVWDLNSNAALSAGIELGWTEEQLQVASDEVFQQILDHQLVASGWTMREDGSDLDAVVVEKPAATRRVRGAKPAEALVDAPAQVVEAAGVAYAVEYTEGDGSVPVLDLGAASVVSEPKPAAPSASASVLMLFIDCRPSKGVDDAQDLALMLAPAMREIEQLKKVSYYDLLPYNEGCKLLAASLLMNPIKGSVYMDSAAPYAKYVLDVLVPMADIVVRA